MRLFLLVLISVLYVTLTFADEDEAKEEKDPWDKSTDKYWHNGGGESSNSPSKQGAVDVTETTESEVHTQKSKVANAPNAWSRDVKYKKLHSSPRHTKTSKKKIKKYHHSKKHHLTKKASFNPQIGDYFPGALWQYPYPYFHQQYAALMSPCACSPGNEENGPSYESADIEAKNDDKDSPTTEVKDENILRLHAPPVKVTKPKKSKNKKKAHKRHWTPWNHINTPTNGFGGGNPYSDLPSTGGYHGLGQGTTYGDPNSPPQWTPFTINRKFLRHSTRQLVPSHYYGPPSAGWGGFQPGKTGCGWGVPYWYKKRDTTYQSSRQLIPFPYVMQISARQLVPSHYYGPPSAGWGGFQPGKTGCGWGVPYWTKSNVAKHEEKHKKPKHSKHVRGSRKFQVASKEITKLQRRNGKLHQRNGGLIDLRFLNGISNYQQLGAMNPQNAFFHQLTPEGGDRTLPQPESACSVPLNTNTECTGNEFENIGSLTPALTGYIHHTGLSPPTQDFPIGSGFLNPQQTMDALGYQHGLGKDNRPQYISTGQFIPANHNEKLQSLDEVAWNGPKSLGSSGWFKNGLANGWVGEMGELDDDPSQQEKKIADSGQKILPGQGIGLPNMGFEGVMTTSMLESLGNPLIYPHGTPFGFEPANGIVRKPPKNVNIITNGFLQNGPALDSFLRFKSKVPKNVKAKMENKENKQKRGVLSRGTRRVLDELHFLAEQNTQNKLLKRIHTRA